MSDSYQAIYDAVRSRISNANISHYVGSWTPGAVAAAIRARGEEKGNG